MGKGFVIAAILIAIIPLLGINHLLAGDEVAWPESVFDVDGEQSITHHHPPLSVWAHIMAYKLMGESVNWRIVPFLFGTLTLILALLLQWDKKWLVLLLLGLNPLHIWGTLQIDIDAGILTFFSLATLGCIWWWSEKKQARWLVLGGMFTGLAMLTKYPGAILLPTALLYILIETKSLKKTIKYGAVFALAGLIVFSLWPLWAWQIGDMQQLYEATRHASHALTRNMRLSDLVGSVLVQLLLAVLWIGPLMFCILYLKKTIKMSKFMTLNTIWICIVLFLYLFISRDPFRPMERYLSAIVPSLAFVGATMWSGVKKKTAWIAAALSAVSITMLATFPRDILPFYPKIGFVKEAIAGNILLELPIAGSSGPLGFTLVLAPLLLLWAFAAIGFLRSTLEDNNTLLVGTTIAYSIFIVTALLGGFSPDVQGVTQAVIDDLNTNNYPQPLNVMMNSWGLHFYLNEHYEEVRHVSHAREFEVDKIHEYLNGTVVVVDFPAFNKKSPLWYELQKCDLQRTFLTDSRPLAYIYTC